MEKGFYLYCIIEKINSKFFASGIDGEKIFKIPHKDLEAIVSEVPLKKYKTEEIQRKAQGDLAWIKKEAMVHEEVIEKAMKNRNKYVNVIPMRFGTIFKTKKSLEKVLKQSYHQFKENLKNLVGKQEWSVKIYLNRRVFEDYIKKNNLPFQKIEKKAASLHEGTAYFIQKQLGDVVSKEADDVLLNYKKNFFRILKLYAENIVENNILEKELTGKSLPMILNISLLISKKKLNNFVKKINKLNKKYRLRGLYFERSGPWPPYNFV